MLKKRFSTNNILLGSIVVSIFILYWHTFSWLVSKWINDPDYSHGFLIPFISGYIIWGKREKLKELPLNSSKWGLFLIVLGLLAEIGSVRAGVSFVSAYSFILVLLGLALYWGGKEMFQELLFPILFLFFMVPFFQFLIDPLSNKLRLLCSYFSVETTEALGIPVFREGVMITLARGKLEVAAPCSGIRSLITFMMLGTIFSYFVTGSLFKKFILFLTTIPLVILGNTFRILASILLLHFHGIIISNTNWETALGIVVFMLVASGLLAVGRLLKCHI